MRPTDLDRRRFLRTAAHTGTGFLLLPVAAAGCKLTDTPVPGFFLSAEQQQAARILADQILPNTKKEPGAGELGIVAYLEQLLTAFDHDPPRIYATANTSGEFVPLNRYQEAAWRLTIYGGPAPANGKPVVGLRELIPQGLDKAISLAPPGFMHLPQFMWDTLIQLLDKDFWQAFSALAVESSFAAPAYGGNQGQAGWRIARFEGGVFGFDSYDPATGLYTENAAMPVSTADPGAQADPLSTVTLLELDVISVFTGGRIYRMKRDDDPLPPIPGASD